MDASGHIPGSGRDGFERERTRRMRAKGRRRRPDTVWCRAYYRGGLGVAMGIISYLAVKERVSARVEIYHEKQLTLTASEASGLKREIAAKAGARHCTVEAQWWKENRTNGTE